MDTERVKTLRAWIATLITAIFLLVCYVVALHGEDHSAEYPAPLPLCIDAPEYTCIIPAQDATDIELGA